MTCWLRWQSDRRLLPGVVITPFVDAVCLLVRPGTIDVGGFETQVPAGAGQALADPGLLAVIMELNGSGARHGFDEEALHEMVLGQGFETIRYRPFERVLEPVHGAHSGGGNTLYVKDVWRLTERVSSARRFRLGSGGAI